MPPPRRSWPHGPASLSATQEWLEGQAASGFLEVDDVDTAYLPAIPDVHARLTSASAAGFTRVSVVDQIDHPMFWFYRLDP